MRTSRTINVLNLTQRAKLMKHLEAIEQLDTTSLNALFEQAKQDSRWDLVKAICDLDSNNKPANADMNTVLLDTKNTKKWLDVFMIEKILNKEEVNPVSGPHQKSVWSRDLEHITYQLLLGKDFEFLEYQDQIYIIIDGTEHFNLTETVKNTNFEHIDLDDQYFVLYRNFMAENNHYCELDRSLTDYYLEKLYPSRPERCISFEEMQAINLYTGGYYCLMNALLRGTYNLKESKDNTKSTIIQSVMCASGLRKIPVIDIKECYRGISDVSELDICNFIKSAAQNKIISLDGFLSSCSDEGVARIVQVNFIFKNLKGSYVAPISQHPEEKEFLIPPVQVQFNNYGNYNYGNFQIHFFEASLVTDLDSIDEKRLLTQYALPTGDMTELNRILEQSKDEINQQKKSSGLATNDLTVLINDATKICRARFPHYINEDEFNFLTNMNKDEYFKQITDKLGSATDKDELTLIRNQILNNLNTLENIRRLKLKSLYNLKKLDKYSFTEISDMPSQEHIAQKTNEINQSRNVLELQAIHDALIDIESREEISSYKQGMMQILGSTSITKHSLFKSAGNVSLDDYIEMHLTSLKSGSVSCQGK